MKEITIGSRVTVPNSSEVRKVVRMFEEDGRVYCKLNNGIGAWEVGTLTPATRKAGR